MAIIKSTKSRKSANRINSKRTARNSTAGMESARTSVHAVPDGSSTVRAHASAEVSVAAKADVADSPSIDTNVQLEPGLEVKDVEDAHRLLMGALGTGRAVIVDVGGVTSMDTAGAQLLVAFQCEATRRGVAVEFCGESATLMHALTVLGMGDNIQFAARRG